MKAPGELKVQFGSKPSSKYLVGLPNLSGYGSRIQETRQGQFFYGREARGSAAGEALYVECLEQQ